MDFSNISFFLLKQVYTYIIFPVDWIYHYKTFSLYSSNILFILFPLSGIYVLYQFFHVSLNLTHYNVLYMQEIKENRKYVHKAQLILKMYNLMWSFMAFIPDAFSNCTEDVLWITYTLSLVNFSVWCFVNWKAFFFLNKVSIKKKTKHRWRYHRYCTPG